MKFFNIFSTENIHRESLISNSGFGILNLLRSGNNWSASQLAYLFVADPVMRLISLLHFYYNKHKQRVSLLFSHFNEAKKDEEINFGFHTSLIKRNKHERVDINVFDFANKDENFLPYRSERIVSIIDNSIDIVPPMIPADLSEYIMKSTNEKVVSSISLRKELCGFYVESCQTRAINLECPNSGPFGRFALSM